MYFLSTMGSNPIVSKTTIKKYFGSKNIVYSLY
jgi:hypothetical protein